MRGKRYVLAVVGAALLASFVLPGVASAQDDEKWRRAYQAFTRRNFSQAETLFREVCNEYQDAGAPWGWCHMMLGVSLAEQRIASKRQEALDQLEVAAELITEDEHRYQTYNAMANIHLLDGRDAQAVFPYVGDSWDRDEIPVDVYSPDGERIFAGFVPDRSWLRARNDWVYGIEHDDETDRQRVVRYRLRLPSLPVSGRR